MTTELQQVGLQQGERTRQQTIEDQPGHCHDGASGPAHVVAGGEAMGAHHHRQQGTLANVGRFCLHFLEMQIPMGLGALVCYLLGSLIPASSSYATAYHPGTYLYATGDVLFLTVPVVVWMIFCGHGWRHSLEMAVAMIAPVAAIIVLGQLAAYAYLLWLVTAGYPAMCLGMLVYMLYRREVFTTGHAGHHHAGSTHAETTKRTTHEATAGVHGLLQQAMGSGARHFIQHYLEMCLAMCVGGITLNVLFFLGAAQIGYPDLIDRFPEFSILVIGILLALPMTAWMRFRGHGWRPTLEMASTSIILAILLIGAARLGIVFKSGMLEWMRSLACPVMLIPMLFRLDLYTGHHGHHEHQAHAAHPADETSYHPG